MKEPELLSFKNYSKRSEYDYLLQERITLTLEEFEKLTRKTPIIRAAAQNSNDNDLTTKPTPTKRPNLKQKTTNTNYLIKIKL